MGLCYVGQLELIGDTCLDDFVREIPRINPNSQSTVSPLVLLGQCLCEVKFLCVPILMPAFSH